MKANSRRASTYAAGLAVALGVLLGVAAVPADLLVLRGGGEIETDGPWRVDGRRVLFETPNGRYSSIRTRDVDLEASRERTRRAKATPAPVEKEPAPAERPEPKWVITEDDVAAFAERDEEQATVEEVVGDRDFGVLSLQTTPDASGFHLLIEGTLVNNGSEFKSDLVVRVRLVDPRSGGVIASRRASLRSDELPPGSATRFTARIANATVDSGTVQIEAMQASDEGFLGS